jgi:hypothetical protein
MSGTIKNEATEQLARELEDLLRRVDTFPTLDRGPESEILGYGDDGMPSFCPFPAPGPVFSIRPKT